MSDHDDHQTGCPPVNPGFYGCCAVSLAAYTGIIFGLCWLIRRGR